MVFHPAYKIKRREIMEHKKKNNNHNKRYNLLLSIFTAGFCICCIIMLYQNYIQNRAEDRYEDLAAMNSEGVTESVTTTDTEEQELDLPVPEKEIDWDSLEQENSDIYAWIYIPNTQVDYPVLQNEENDNYYLDHNIDRSKGYPGAIYSQSVNQKDFSDVWTVLYGHNMGNGTMFGSLREFKDNEFFEENQYIYIYTKERTFIYKIYSACTFGDQLLCDSYSFGLTVGVRQFLAETAEVRDMSSHVRNDFDMPDDTNLLTLSTCIKNSPDKRWLVNGVLLGSVRS